MSVYQTKSFEERLEFSLLNHVKILYRQGQNFDFLLRDILKKNWKERRFVGDISDSIHHNNEANESLKNEIKDRSSRIVKK